jgi:hypothetical protein
MPRQKRVFPRKTRFCHLDEQAIYDTQFGYFVPPRSVYSETRWRLSSQYTMNLYEISGDIGQPSETKKPIKWNQEAKQLCVTSQIQRQPKG